MVATRCWSGPGRNAHDKTVPWSSSALSQVADLVRETSLSAHRRSSPALSHPAASSGFLVAPLPPLVSCRSERIASGAGRLISLKPFRGTFSARHNVDPLDPAYCVLGRLGTGGSARFGIAHPHRPVPCPLLGQGKK